jgi:hypothetical protein
VLAYNSGAAVALHGHSVTLTRDHSDSPEPRRVLQCDACGRCEDCSADQLLRYTREGWPRCCGRAMAFYTEATHPTADALSLHQTPPATAE